MSRIVVWSATAWMARLPMSALLSQVGKAASSLAHAWIDPVYEPGSSWQVPALRHREAVGAKQGGLGGRRTAWTGAGDRDTLIAWYRSRDLNPDEVALNGV